MRYNDLRSATVHLLRVHRTRGREKKTFRPIAVTSIAERCCVTSCVSRRAEWAGTSESSELRRWLAYRESPQRIAGKVVADDGRVDGNALSAG
jgi:hypothetical protein